MMGRGGEIDGERRASVGTKMAPHLALCLVRGYVRLKGFEPPTFCSGGRRSIH